MKEYIMEKDVMLIGTEIAMVVKGRMDCLVERCVCIKSRVIQSFVAKWKDGAGLHMS
jgi:hypothetical protein